ncbi:MAG: DUF2088 domain-containing protein [Acidobacteria bacterium]|nr:DUF2088 domain-containing protein [Acidobacteriota bacterium]
MKYLTYSGNNLIHANLPDSSQIVYPPSSLAGMATGEIASRVREVLESPLGMAPLKELVNSHSRVLIAFDDNCQPFPPMRKPDVREVIIKQLLEMLYQAEVPKRNIQLICAVALHRKMKAYELEWMLGAEIMNDFYPAQLSNFDAEDASSLVYLGDTEMGEPVETAQAVVESDLVIYVDTVQIPLNSGHKAVAVGLGTYRSIAPHHSPHMTSENPHVMQPENSHMHASIERMSRVIQKHARIMILEAAMNGSTYPPHLSFLSKPAERSSALESILRNLTPLSMHLLPEWVRRKIFSSIRSWYQPVEINAGDIDQVHPRTLAVLKKQLEVSVEGRFDTLVFGLPDLSPYSVGARINPVLVVSDVLGYVFNWFYNQPFLRKGGVVIILNPAYEVFHPEYHVAYQKFWEEVLPKTRDPFEMEQHFQEKFARDPYLIECYRHRWAHHGFHPFTVWYWATYPLKYLSKVILVGPGDARVAKHLGVAWAPSLRHALGWAREITGGERVIALNIPPFMYLTVNR